MSIVKTLLKKAKQLRPDHKSIARNKYTDLVRQLAGGEALDPERVLEILAAAGKSEADLKRDVEALGTSAELESLKIEEQDFRDRKRELIDEVADLKQQLESIRIQIETLGGKLNLVSYRLTRTHDRRLELQRNFPD